MDPVSALGLAASVVQCVQFTSSLLKGTHDIYSSAQGFSEQGQELDRIYRRLSVFSSDLAKQSTISSQWDAELEEYKDPLKELASSCQKACGDLLSVVEQLKTGNGKQRLWKSFTKALKEVLKQDDLRRLQENIGRIESLMVLHMSAISIENTGRLHVEVQRLITQGQQLGCSHETDLQSIRIHISQIVSKLDHWIEKRGSGGADGADIGLLTTRLSELSIESRKISIAQNLLLTLNYSQRPLRHANIPEAHARTYSWALRGREPEEVVSSRHGQGNLSRWLSSEHGIFWISGKPGSGKSTFMKYIADHPDIREALSQWASPREVIIASHYFWSAGTSIQKSQQGLWQSLLFAILSKEPDAIPEVCRDRWQLKSAQLENNASRSTWGISELRNCFSRLAHLESTRSRFCVFIDGLDEFDGDHLDIVQTLIKLSRSPMVKLCVSSRPWNVFETSLGHSPLSKIYMHELTKGDVLRFSEHQLAQHPRWATEVGPVEAGLLINDIANRAQGVFLWVFLVTKLLREGLTNHDTPEDLRRTLHSLHPDLEQFFKQILDGVSQMYHTKMAGFLKIALAADDPLDAYIYHFHELEYNDVDFALKEETSCHNEQHIQTVCSRVRFRLNAFCKGLLEVDRQGKVQYIHRTVKDWLETAVMTCYLKEKVKPDFNPQISILRAYLAWHKHPPFDNEIKLDIFRDTTGPEHISYHSTMIVRIEQILSYANTTELLSQTQFTDVSHSILDELTSATEQMFRAGLVTFGEQNAHRPESRCDVMLRSIFALKAPWWYIVRKARECPDYFSPLVQCPNVVDLEDWLLTHPTRIQTNCTRSEVATVILKQIIDEFIPEEILFPDGGHWDTWGYDKKQAPWFRSDLETTIQAGADVNIIIWTTADSLPIPAWMVMTFLAFRVDLVRSMRAADAKWPSCVWMSSLEARKGMDFGILFASSDTGSTLWKFFCNHISALQEDLKHVQYNSIPQTSAIQAKARSREWLLSFNVWGLLRQMLESRVCHDLPWRDLMPVVNQWAESPIVKRLKKQLQERLEDLHLLPEHEDPDAGPARDVIIANVVGPTMSVCPKSSGKRSPAELLANESVKRARRCSF